MRKQVFDLYWLTYLLTGDRACSVAAVVKTVEALGGAGAVFENWYANWSRKIFIARVLDRPPLAPDPLELRARLRKLQARNRSARLNADRESVNTGAAIEAIELSLHLAANYSQGQRLREPSAINA